MHKRSITARPATMPCLLAGLAAGLAMAAATADTLRCGSRIIKDGDTQEKVLAVCGEPTARQRTWIERAPQYELSGQWYSYPGTEFVPVDLWTYDFGPNRLVQRVRFVDGRLDSIETLGRGTSEY
ncbi:MAG: DUF2845 domain-containing protein [Steroidobacteraceae bacterium]